MEYLDLSSFETKNCNNFNDIFGDIEKIKVKVDANKGENLKNYLESCINVEIVE